MSDSIVPHDAGESVATCAPLTLRLADLLPAYATYVASLGTHHTTPGTYCRQIRAFITWAGEDATAADLHEARVAAYLEQRRAGWEQYRATWSDATPKNQRNVLRAFALWIGSGCPAEGTPRDRTNEPFAPIAPTPPALAPKKYLVHPGTLPLLDAMEEWIVDLRLDGRAKGTIGKHKQEIVRLNRWLTAEALDWQTIRARELKIYTRERADKSFSARSNMLCSLRVFYTWAIAQDYVAESPAQHFKTPSKPNPLPRTLTRDQVAALITYVATIAGRRARRDQAVVLTMLYAGLRCAECAQLRWNDLDMSGKLINIPISKMNHGRVVVIHPALHKALTDWRAIQGLGDAAPVFGDTHADCTYGRQLDPRRLGKIIKRIAAGMDLKFTAHQLRHSFATHMLRGSGNLYAVSKSLGHSDIKQTMRYVSVDVEYLREAVNKLPGIGEW